MRCGNYGRSRRICECSAVGIWRPEPAPSKIRHFHAFISRSFKLADRGVNLFRMPTSMLILLISAAGAALLHARCDDSDDIFHWRKAYFCSLLIEEYEQLPRRRRLASAATHARHDFDIFITNTGRMPISLRFMRMRTLDGRYKLSRRGPILLIFYRWHIHCN